MNKIKRVQIENDENENKENQNKNSNNNLQNPNLENKQIKVDISPQIKENEEESEEEFGGSEFYDLITDFLTAKEAKEERYAHFVNEIIEIRDELCKLDSFKTSHPRFIRIEKCIVELTELWEIGWQKNRKEREKQRMPIVESGKIKFKEWKRNNVPDLDQKIIQNEIQEKNFNFHSSFFFSKMRFLNSKEENEKNDNINFKLQNKIISVENENIEKFVESIFENSNENSIEEFMNLFVENADKHLKSFGMTDFKWKKIENEDENLICLYVSDNMRLHSMCFMPFIFINFKFSENKPKFISLKNRKLISENILNSINQFLKDEEFNFFENNSYHVVEWFLKDPKTSIQNQNQNQIQIQNQTEEISMFGISFENKKIIKSHIFSTSKSKEIFGTSKNEIIDKNEMSKVLNNILLTSVYYSINSLNLKSWISMNDQTIISSIPIFNLKNKVVILKIFECENSNEIENNERIVKNCLENIENSKIEFSFEDEKFKIVSYPFIEGTIVATNVKQILEISKQIQKLHSKGKIHGDIKTGNIIFNQDNPKKSKLIDFEFVGLKRYPSNFNTEVSERHENAKPNEFICFEHDWFSFGSVLSQYNCQQNEKEWKKVCFYFKQNKHQEAIELLKSKLNIFFISHKETSIVSNDSN